MTAAAGTDAPDQYAVLARVTIARFGLDPLQVAYRRLEPRRRSLPEVAVLLDALGKLETSIGRNPSAFGSFDLWIEAGRALEAADRLRLWDRAPISIDEVMGRHVSRSR